MSLLLDALKRAEQDKQARQGGRESTGPQLVAAAKPTLELHPISQPEVAVAPARTPSPSAAPALPPARARSRRGVLWVAGGLIVLVIAVAVSYVWYSIAALAPRPSAIARAPAPRPITPVASDEASRATASARENAALDLRTPPTAPPAGQGEPAAAKRAPEGAATNPAAAPAALLQPSRAAERPRVPPEIAAGYEALRRGDLATAMRAYAAGAAADPTNLDAALGLATVEARAGNRESAAAHYKRALDVDPRNPTALAGLAALMDFSRPDALEPQLLRDITQHPDSAALHFMLGNLYASHARWSQAQAAYYEAHRLEPANADILHNLAVSLDHLGQSRVAAGFYRRALEAARGQPAAFDPAIVMRRLADLEPGR